MALDYLKKHWLAGLHLLVVLLVFLDPSVNAYIAAHPKESGTLAFVWAEIMRWIKSPRNQ